MGSVGTFLRNRAAELGLSDAEVARRLDIGQKRYSNYVKDTREPDFATFKKICRVLGTTPDRVLSFGGPGLAEDAAVYTAGEIEFSGDRYCAIAKYRIEASAGDGRDLPSQPEISNRVLFRHEWLRRVTAAPIDRLAVVEVVGDSMLPTLHHGDNVLVDTTQKRPAQRDSIYVINTDGALQVKRLQVHPRTKVMRIISDNPLYQAWEENNLEAIEVIGRVIWIGRAT